MDRKHVLSVSLILLLTGFIPRQADPSTLQAITIDDFESYTDGSLPTRWKYLYEGKLVWVEPNHMFENEKFYVGQEDGNKFLRAYTHGEAVHLSMVNEKEGFDWDLRTHPILRWDWRALRLPDGANESISNLNDAGLGLYIFFSFDGFIVKRPKAIKYTYSSSLPVGTVLRQDKLRVIVVANGAEGFGKWMEVKRNVAEDYRQVFGENPPDRPLSIRLWSDSDNTNTYGEGDFDNIELLPQ